MQHRHDQSPALVEIVTPRVNTTPVSAVARTLAACALPEPFSLEIAGTAHGRSFLIRANQWAIGHLEQQLLAAYPQATMRALGIDRCRALDPAWQAEGEQVAVRGLTLAAGAHLPLRVVPDADRRGAPAADDDPVLGILAALAGLPPGWRALCQLLLRPAEADWAAPYARLALERPLAAEPAVAGPSWGSLAAMVGAITALAVIPNVGGWYEARDWWPLGLAGCAGVAMPLGVWVRRRLARSAPADPQLIREKLAHVAFRAHLRLAVFAPSQASPGDLLGRLDSLAAAYGPFAQPRGNALVPTALHLRGENLTSLRALPARGRRWLPPPWRRGAESLLNVQELAGLWHLPATEADVPLLERTTARRWQPLPAAVSHGCRIGRSAGSAGDVPVSLSDDLLYRHLLLVAKTRRGKSSLLLRLVQHTMDGAGTTRPALVLVDPHHDLARAALGLVPAHRRDRVVYLDLANSERPVGLNLLDTGLGWDAERAVANALSVFRHQWDQYWGPRMEDIFRMVLHTLHAANAARCAADHAARAEQYTILEVPLLLADPAFRQQVVAEGGDAFVAEWWRVFYDHLLDRRLQIESINPVLTKINRLAASRSSRALLGQPCSTIAPATWLREGRVVIVHTAQGIVGADTAALLGGTLLNLLKLEVYAQAALSRERRRPVTVVVDEFHTVPGADYEAFLGELAKYGANLVLATQTLARLDAIDRAHERALRATLFSNLDGLFVFHCSAEDARYLVPELGGDLEVDDLVSLGEHRCYARLSARGERLPAFSLALDPPPATDPGLADRLAAASAHEYGRPRELVEAVRATLHARVDTAHRRAMERVRRVREEPPAPPAADGKSGKRARATGSGPPVVTTPELPFGPGAGLDDSALSAEPEGKESAP